MIQIEFIKDLLRKVSEVQSYKQYIASTEKLCYKTKDVPLFAQTRGKHIFFKITMSQSQSSWVS